MSMDSHMKATGPTLMDVIAPPGNHWLQTLLNGKAASLPPGVRVVRYETQDEPDESPPRRNRREAAIEQV